MLRPPRPRRSGTLDRLEVMRLTLASVLTLVLGILEFGGHAGSVPRVFVGVRGRARVGGHRPDPSDRAAFVSYLGLMT